MMFGMDEQSFPTHNVLNMHVKPTELVNYEVGMPRELTESDLSTQKAAVRALLVTRLEKIWNVCEPHIEDALGTGTDVRMAELALRVIDRLAKLHEVSEPDRGRADLGDEATITQARRDEVLKALTERRGHLDGQLGG